MDAHLFEVSKIKLDPGLCSFCILKSQIYQLLECCTHKDLMVIHMRAQH